ncbi:MAG: hypothetical protein IJR52_02640 [Selenomonadaceae bacterium]|nr:hypothetical protein [Selenomonadaceae bacterium]MBQ9496455.1 hypothetical protein [Selenomonadaceae bacterium]
MIHVCYGFRDKTGHYAKFAGISMLSVLENTKKEITFHILHDKTLTDENREKFSQLAEHYGQTVNFYNLSELIPKKISKIIKLVPGLEKMVSTVGAFYKVLIPQVLPTDINKAIFLDPDTIVNLDIAELWKTKLGKNILGVVTETKNGVNPEKTFVLCSEGIVKPEDYFNCGVLLMNLKLLRKEEKTITNGIKFRGENPKHKWLEQTVLNYCFSADTVKLPIKFNCFVRKERSSGSTSPLGKKIYHYAGGTSRPGLDASDPCNQLWMSYFIRTPWFNAEALGKLYANIRKTGAVRKDLTQKLAQFMPGKMRAFFVEPAKLKKVKDFFAIKDYEEIILAENEASISQLITAMREVQGACIFFILTEKIAKNNFPFERLTKAGFEEGKDFLKAWEFFSAAKEAPFDSYPLIETL